MDSEFGFRSTNRSDLRAKALALAGRQYGVITRVQALEIGLSPRVTTSLVNSGEWDRLRRGIFRVASAVPSWRQDLVAACLACGPGAAASHRGSAALFKLEGIPTGFVEVTTPTPGKNALPGIILHRSGDLTGRDLTRLDGIPSTNVERTLIDLGSVCSDFTVEAALEDALRRKLTSLELLSGRLKHLEARGRPGPRALRHLIDLRAPGQAPAESNLELRFLSLIKEWGFPPPEAQFVVHDRRRPVARIDFAYPQAMIAIECDGYLHHSGRASWDKDRERKNLLTALGWRLVSVTWTDVTMRPGRLKRIIGDLLELTL